MKAILFVEWDAWLSLVVVGDDGEFARRELEVDELVVAHKRLQADHSTNSGARSPPVLDHHQGGSPLASKWAENLVQGNMWSRSFPGYMCSGHTFGDVGERGGLGRFAPPA